MVPGRRKKEKELMLRKISGHLKARIMMSFENLFTCSHGHSEGAQAEAAIPDKGVGISQN